MALVSRCDQCESSWRTDNLVYVDAVNRNLCSVCLNQLVDILVGTCNESTWQSVKKVWEND